MPCGRCGKIGLGFPENMGGVSGQWTSKSEPESSFVERRHYLGPLNRLVWVTSSLQFKKPASSIHPEGLGPRDLTGNKFEDIGFGVLDLVCLLPLFTSEMSPWQGQEAGRGVL